MALTFEEMRSNKGSMGYILTALEKLNTNKADNRFWTLSVDKAGNGYAVIRFLPPPPNEDVPFIRMWNYSFQNPVTGKWYIENSPSTIGLPDPVTEDNSRLWNSNIEENKKLASTRIRKTSFIMNIYVIEDPVNPSNEGKVFLFKAGKKIFSKIEAAAHPEFKDEKEVDMFCLWTGADFKLKARNEDKRRNYDRSEFSAQKPLVANDDKDASRAREIHEQCYSLQEFVKPGNFKSYEELKAKFEEVTGTVIPKSSNSERLKDLPHRVKDDVGEDESAPFITTKEVKHTKLPKVDDDSDDINYFNKLAED